ncbi:hypothetical protein PI124_g19973 [Phytophthora idaei]|nr:hypothetical protein PI125_g20999 [Phytophthora idaei]KAG3132830.1 hypothetical protein PI126_g19464 [Phytophthora idaei]KAG3234988.1 hypothetical protein PI124_g19973 [Phytophthora idaei]
MWVKMRGECPSAAANLATPMTAARDDQSTRFFVVLYERRHWLVESSVLMGLHLDLNPSATPEELTEMFDVWTRYKLARKRRSDVLRSLVVSAYDNLYSAVTHQLSGQPAPLVDAEVYFDPAVPHYSPVNLSWIPSRTDWIQCAHDVDMEEPWRARWLTDPAAHPCNTFFRARNVDFMVFAPRGMDPRVVEDAIEEDFDLAEPAPPRIAAGAPPLELTVVASTSLWGTGLGELGPDSDGGSGHAGLADDGLGSPNTHGGSPNTSLFGTPSPESPSTQHDDSANSATAPADPSSSAPVSVPPGSSAMGLLVAAATAASPVVAPQSMVSAPSQLQLTSRSSRSQSPPS